MNILLVYDNTDTYRIYIVYAKKVNKVKIQIFDKFNFSIGRYYESNNEIIENFIELYNSMIFVEYDENKN